MYAINDGKLITSVEAKSAEAFDSVADLKKLADDKAWSKADVTAIWNANVGRFPGIDKTVKRFRNRPYGLDRLWEALAGEQAVLGNGKPHKPIKASKSKASAAKRDGSQREKVLELLKRDGGASGAELQKATGWQPHTVRGFISTLQSKHGVKVESSKDAERGRVYRAV